MKNKREALIKFLRIKLMHDDEDDEKEKEEINKLTSIYTSLYKSKMDDKLENVENK